MENVVDETIAGLRSVLSAQNNAELARKLGIDQSTISSWRSRGRVPNRFVQMLEPPKEGVSKNATQSWPELEERGQSIALVRFTILRQKIASSGDVDTALPVFLDLLPFWLVMHRAVHELRLKMEALKVDLKTAQALLMQEDLRDPQATLDRVANQLEEDLKDNPHLKEWK
ncbi:hypothetical protein [Roseobacter denitrificans]|uniref:hypothetical protein n=1 Tax=Roseobacter denitrificans TaxID=2434 RepID=UPI0008E4CF23|nr:hypothetical protein [Roseobacter denitrificans]SFF69177.1 hypothetical protein SAMN05443635_10168 [Roseobacter denitrificans OCh 114]